MLTSVSFFEPRWRQSGLSSRRRPRRKPGKLKRGWGRRRIFFWDHLWKAFRRSTSLTERTWRGMCVFRTAPGAAPPRARRPHRAPVRARPQGVAPADATARWSISGRFTHMHLGERMWSYTFATPATQARLPFARPDSLLVLSCTSSSWDRRGAQI